MTQGKTGQEKVGYDKTRQQNNRRIGWVGTEHDME